MCEQTGLIVELDMIMYEKVLNFSEIIHRSGPGVCSRLGELLAPPPAGQRLPQQNRQKQCEYGVPAHLIEIELTESAIFDNIDTIYAFTRKMHMHANGFAIAMDDFGSAIPRSICSRTSPSMSSKSTRAS